MGKNRPVQSLLHLNSLLSFVNNEKAGLRLCQEFICYNPARLPSPAQWVTIHRIRAINSFTHVWWISNSDYPKADNRTLINQYAQFLQRNLGISDLEVQAVWASLAAYIEQRICIYSKAVEQIQVAVSKQPKMVFGSVITMLILRPGFGKLCCRLVGQA